MKLEILLQLMGNNSLFPLQKNESQAIMESLNFIDKIHKIENKLFLTCPVSHMEAFIKRTYGWDDFFLSAPGAVFSFWEINYAEALRDFIERRDVKKIIIVNTASCPFIKSVLEKEEGFKTKAEQVLTDLYIDNYTQIMRKTSSLERKIVLANLNIQRQADELVSNDLLQPIIQRSKIKISGLIVIKEKGILKEVTTNLLESIK